MIGKYRPMPATDRDQCAWDREILGDMCTMDGLNRIDRSKPEGSLIWRVLYEAWLAYRDAEAKMDAEKYRMAHRLYVVAIAYTVFHEIPTWSD